MGMEYGLLACVCIYMLILRHHVKYISKAFLCCYLNPCDVYILEGIYVSNASLLEHLAVAGTCPAK